jgi:heat shock protein beta
MIITLLVFSFPLQDNTNRNRLAKLLRFHTSKSIDKLTSLEDYVGRMKEGQREIYFLAGMSVDQVKAQGLLGFCQPG